MALLGFKNQFVAPIQRFEKLHTIRGDRKIPIKVGETLYHYALARQPGMYRIITPRPCSRIDDIIISPRGNIRVSDVRLEEDELIALAKADGFADYETMLAFWKGRLPFEGNIIHWKKDAL